jgi:hypothetical protein
MIFRKLSISKHWKNQQQGNNEGLHEMIFFAKVLNVQALNAV